MEFEILRLRNELGHVLPNHPEVKIIQGERHHNANTCTRLQREVGGLPKPSEEPEHNLQAFRNLWAASLSSPQAYTTPGPGVWMSFSNRVRRGRWP